MPNYLLYWDSVKEDYELTISVTPDDGVTVRGSLIAARPGKKDVQKELTHNDLVPKWTRKMKDQEAVTLFLALEFLTKATKSVRIEGVCLKTGGGVHQDSYDETYTGKRPLTTPVHVAAIP
ncbi:MAG TPA: hypothetical protein VES88_12515 [Gemmatimonadaceae bacterium]|nr:hypothetical protein [Gemmatimonadaceae bacterium]